MNIARNAQFPVENHAGCLPEVPPEASNPSRPFRNHGGDMKGRERAENSAGAVSWWRRKETSRKPGGGGAFALLMRIKCARLLRPVQGSGQESALARRLKTERSQRCGRANCQSEATMKYDEKFVFELMSSSDEPGRSARRAIRMLFVEGEGTAVRGETHSRNRGELAQQFVLRRKGKLNAPNKDGGAGEGKIWLESRGPGEAGCRHGRRNGQISADKVREGGQQGIDPGAAAVP